MGNNNNKKVGKTWREIIDAKQKKGQQVVASISPVPATKTTGVVPVHSPHIVFDKSYVNKELPDMANLAKVSEDVRHLQFHNHGPEFAY